MAESHYDEQRNPTVPACGPTQIRLKFSGHELTMRAGKHFHSYYAVSGKTGVYEPIRKGNYWIQPSETLALHRLSRLADAVGRHDLQ